MVLCGVKVAERINEGVVTGRRGDRRRLVSMVSYPAAGGDLAGMAGDDR